MARLFIILLFFTAFLLKAQDSIPAALNKSIEHELEKQERLKSDFWMPQDQAPVDENKLSVTRGLTDSPLKTYDWLKWFNSKLSNMSMEKSWDFMQSVLTILDLDRNELLSLDNSVSSAELDRALGIKVDSVLKFIPASLFRQYISPMVKINNEMYKDFLGIKSGTLGFLKDNADYIAVPSKLPDGANYYQFLANKQNQEQTEDKFLKYAQSGKKSMIWSYGVSLYLQLIKQLARTEKGLQILKDSVKTQIIKTKLGDIGIGGIENNNWNGDFIFIIDVGGNDRYNLTTSKNQASSKLIRYIIDLDGNDTYTGNDYSYASGYFGINILIDLNGNDVYKTGKFSLGSGVFGIGILHDFQGDDRYQSAQFSQGAAFYGLGLLIDKSGNDIYEAKQESQGFGFIKGLGVVADYSGNDSYKITSDEMNGKFLSFGQGAARGIQYKSCGGIGVLCDLNGADQYAADAYSQGAADCYGIGVFLDQNGNDVSYSGFNSKGFGCFGGIGLYADESGNDIYSSEFKSYGQSEKFGSGIFEDFDGNDLIIRYDKKFFDENFKGFRFYANYSGNDSLRINTFSDSLIFRNLHSIDYLPGMIISSADTARTFLQRISDSLDYSERIRDLNPQRDFYLKYSVNSVNLDESQISTTPEIIFEQAITNLKEFRLVANNARSFVLANPLTFLNLIPKKLNDKKEETISLITEIISKLTAQDSVNIIKILEDSLKSRNFDIVCNSAVLLVPSRSKKLFDLIPSLLSERNWKKKVLALKICGLLGDSLLFPYCMSVAKDPSPMVRAEAGRSLGKIMPPDFLTLAKPFLEDDKLIVREFTISGIKPNSILYDNYISIFNNIGSFKNKRTFASVFGAVDTKTIDLEGFYQILNETPPQVRESFYNSIIKSGKEFWRLEYQKILALESENYLKSLFPVQIAAPAEEPVKKKRKKK